MNDVLNNRKKFYESSYPSNRFQNILSATKTQPNEMLPIYDKSKLPYLIKKAITSGIDDILIITGNQLENSIWKINETKASSGEEIHQTNTPSKLNSLYGAIFEGNPTIS